MDIRNYQHCEVHGPFVGKSCSRCGPDWNQGGVLPSSSPASVPEARNADIVPELTPKAEKTIQGEIAQYLRLHEIQYIKPDMRKKSPLPKGWPDLTFAYRGVPLALEAKILGEKPREDQAEMHEKLRANGWRVETINGVADIQRIMREIDIIHDGENGIKTFSYTFLMK